MPISRTIKCEVCKREEIEVVYGVGWPGWGRLDGVVDGNQGEGCLNLCPEDLLPVIELLEKRRKT